MSSDDPLAPQSEATTEANPPEAAVDPAAMTDSQAASDDPVPPIEVGSQKETTAESDASTQQAVDQPNMESQHSEPAPAPEPPVPAPESMTAEATSASQPEESPVPEVTTPPMPTGGTLADSTTDLPADANPTPEVPVAPEQAALSTDNAVAETLNASEAVEGVPTDAPGVDVASEVLPPTEPAADTGADDTVVAESAAETLLEEATESKPKPRLNPTGSGEAKAVPTYEGDAGQQPSAGPVEVPRAKDVEIDADLDAQISAAMTGDATSAGTPAADGSAAPETITPPEEYPTEDTLEAGVALKGKVQSIHGEDVFVDVGYRSPGVAQLKQFGKNPPEEGKVLDLTVSRVDTAEGLIHLSLPRGPQKVSGDWDQVSKGQVVDVVVNKTNKGGLDVQVGSLRGFMPASQVDVRYTEDLDQFVGQKLRAQITEVNPKRKNLIVSRRSFLQIERREAEEMLWTKLDVGQQYTGTVKTLKDYGAFIDIGGVDGFLHISDISWTRIRHPSDELSVDQQVEVKVITLDREKKKIGLGLKQLSSNPWAEAEDKYAKGATVSGKVVKVTDFGAFVELEPSVEALVHISELDYRRVHKVTEILQVGETYDFQVLEVQPQKRRISLSKKALLPKPERSDNRKKVKDEDLAPSGGANYERKRKGPLKGGTGGTGAGGLFGNPNDFGSDS